MSDIMANILPGVRGPAVCPSANDNSNTGGEKCRSAGGKNESQA